MQYTVHIDIDRPRDEVIAKMDDADNLVKWQEGLQSFTLIEGEAGQKGAKSELVFLMGKREMKMVETIIERDFPERFDATYDAKNVHNIVRNRFLETGPNTTRWESENVFEFKGVMKLMGVLAKGAFPKQSLKYMQDFKAFVEDGTDVRDRKK